MTTNLLVNPESIREVAVWLRLLGDATRLRIIGLLRGGELNVSALCAELDLAQPTVRHHLGLLRNAGLVQTRRAGKQVYYMLNDDEIQTRGGDLCLCRASVEVRFASI